MEKTMVVCWTCLLLAVLLNSQGGGGGSYAMALFYRIPKFYLLLAPLYAFGVWVFGCALIHLVAPRFERT